MILRVQLVDPDSGEVRGSAECCPVGPRPDRPGHATDRQEHIYAVSAAGLASRAYVQAMSRQD